MAADPSTLDYLDLAQVVIVALDREGTVTRINRKGCEVLERSPSEIVGRNWFRTVVPERVRGRLSEVFAELMAGRVEAVEYVENPIVTRGGQERLIAWRNAVVRDAGGTIVGSVSSGEDITERKKARQELADIKYALDQAAIVAITDQKGVIHYVNDKFCQISKYSRDELLGQDHRILNSGTHPPEFFRDLWKTISAGRVWRGEIRNRAKDGTHYWVDTTIVPFVDGRGKPYQYLAIRSDITGRKKAQEDLRRQEALATLGRMAAVVAHEVKNPLAGIAGAIEIIGDRLPEESSEREIVASILQRIETLNRRVQDLLLFSRPRSLKISTVAVPALLRDTASLLAQDPSLSGVDVEVVAGPCQLAGDAELLKDVFLNLMLNAAQAMNGTGRVRVVCETVDRTCRISVHDRGPGIPEDVVGRMFEPFFTTKHRGTGLGLSIAKRVVEDHGGGIEVTSHPGTGTTVTVTLPLQPAPAPVGDGRAT